MSASRSSWQNTQTQIVFIESAVHKPKSHVPIKSCEKIILNVQVNGSCTVSTATSSSLSATLGRRRASSAKGNSPSWTLVTCLINAPWSCIDCSTPLRYGSNLVSVSSFRQNNFTGELAQQQLQTSSPEDAYWLGYQTQNELQTNTLASASGSQISQYYGHWAQEQPDTNDGRCVEALLPEDPRRQQWALTRCETLLPFMCQIQVCKPNDDKTKIQMGFCRNRF